MQFDTTNVPVFDSAALEMTVLNGDLSATIEYALLNNTEWAESDSALNPPPQYVLQLAQEQRDWLSNTRYSIPLRTDNLQSSIINMSVAPAANQVVAANGITVASRENSLEMPLLVVRGSGDFCNTFRANVATLGAEAGETESTPSDTTEDTAEDTDEDTTSDDGAASGTQDNTNGGGGASGLLTLMALLGIAIGRSISFTRRRI